ncbi:AlpA family transcriptional regulator [Mitsuaria sp. 7]|uniref:helix-turn-helix transcriptional regulator n=1 Tax=Mitsuaria sp. 7 TaxID=1658665 RepID=UPI0012FBB1E7|nr:helix-turn-helix domain-containing protein [Mitsuaria sp. 7]
MAKQTQDLEFVTKNELASMLKVTARTVSNYVRKGAIPPPVKVGRRALWRRVTVAQMFETLESATAFQNQANFLGREIALAKEAAARSVEGFANVQESTEKSA